MKETDIITQLEFNIHVFKNLLLNIPQSEINWKPSEDKWCLLEIICHLYDEEREDFRARLAKILHNDINWNPIDPQGWITSRNYIYENYYDKLNGFLHERKKSVTWLKSLNLFSWNIEVVHPNFGKFSAKQMLAEWLAHDFLHIRQIIKTQFLYLEDFVKPNSIRYAGKW